MSDNQRQVVSVEAIALAPGNAVPMGEERDVFVEEVSFGVGDIIPIREWRAAPMPTGRTRRKLSFTSHNKGSKNERDN